MTQQDYKPTDTKGIKREKKSKDTPSIWSRVKQVYTDSTNVLKNLEHFVEAVSLLMVAGFTYWASSRVGISNWSVLVFQFASIVIGIRGGWELLKQMNKR